MTMHAELTIKEILADPITRALMKADRIDPAALEVFLRSPGLTPLAFLRQRSISEAGERSNPAPPALDAFCLRD